MRKIVDYVNVTMAVFFGLYLMLLTFLGWDWIVAIPGGIIASSGWRALFGVLALALVFLNGYILYLDLKTGGLREKLRISTEHGRTDLSVPSIEMLILGDLRNEPDIVDPYVRLKPRAEGKPMRCTVDVKLRRQRNVVKRGDDIKRKVRDIIDQLIPGGLTVEVVVEVREIVNEPAPDAVQETPKVEEFNGPVYTNDTGSDGV